MDLKPWPNPTPEEERAFWRARRDRLQAQQDAGALGINGLALLAEAIRYCEMYEEEASPNACSDGEPKCQA